MGGQRNAQHRGRRLARSFARPEQQRERAAGFGGKLQPPQLDEAGRARPDEHAAASRRVECLLRRPQGVAVLGGFDDHHTGEIDAGGGERRRIRQVRRGDPGDEFPLRRKPRKGRAEQAQLADAFVLRQDFSERAAGPAAARQLGVERGKTGGNAGVAGAREFGPAPDARVLAEFGSEAHRRPFPRLNRRVKLDMAFPKLYVYGAVLVTH